jgi:hypothetical protein
LPVPPRASFYVHLGPSPVCKPDDRLKARTYLAKIQHTIDLGGWSSTERRRLYRLRDRWHARAYGEDSRFKQWGTRPGRTPQGNGDHC